MSGYPRPNLSDCVAPAGSYEPRGRVIRPATPEDGPCAVCAAELGHLVDYVPVPSASICDLYASDYDGLNMGMDDDAPGIALCWECVINCLWWIEQP